MEEFVSLYLDHTGIDTPHLLVERRFLLCVPAGDPDVERGCCDEIEVNTMKFIRKPAARIYNFNRGAVVT